MKHFVIELIYKAPIEKIQEVRPSHREFIQKLCDNGTILMAGIQVPGIGGVLVAKANSMEEIADILSNDPYQIENLAHYQYIEFSPVIKQDFLSNWVQ